MSRNEHQDITEILKELKATTDLGQRLEEAEIWEHWREIAGPELAPHAAPVIIREGTLVIAVDSPVWMHKISYKKSEIIDKSNNFLSKEKLSEIFLTLKSDADEKPPENSL